MAMNYKLSAELKGHDQDIKAVISLGTDTVVSGSRDGKIVEWKREKDGSWSDTLKYSGTSFINSLAWGLADGKYYVLSGGQDEVINWSALAPEEVSEQGFEEPEYVLVGHEKNVCALSSLVKEDLVVSGSWDTTAIVWQNKQKKHVLEGHAGAVWDVQFVDDHRVLTCSADKTVKLWQDGQLVHTYSGLHTDVIRSLVVLDLDTFVSASNDGTLKQVSISTGKVTRTFNGHSNYIYKVVLLNGNTLVSCGEDRSVKIWDIGTAKAVQTIFLPCISVWTLAVLDNKDIVVGGSDSFVRVFTSDEARVDHNLNQALEDEVKSLSVSVNQIDDSKVSSVDVLSLPGKKEGQVVMVKKETGTIEAHQWANNQWTLLGEVVGGEGASSTNLQSSGKKVEYLGKKYDYVFDVDVKEGQPPLKLPFNLTDNPYVVADKFLADYELPSSYKSQVIEFILQNTQGVELGGAPQVYDDPYADRNPATSFVVYDTFKKDLLLKGIDGYNAKADLGVKLSKGEISEISKLLDDVSSKKNSQELSQLASSIIQSGEIVGYDLLRIIIKNISDQEDFKPVILRGLAITDKSTVINTDVAKLIMVVRCVSNLLASKRKFPYIDPLSLDKFYTTKVQDNSEVKETVKAKLKDTIQGLKTNLGLV